MIFLENDLMMTLVTFWTILAVKCSLENYLRDLRISAVKVVILSAGKWYVVDTNTYFRNLSRNALQHRPLFGRFPRIYQLFVLALDHTTLGAQWV